MQCQRNTFKPPHHYLLYSQMMHSVYNITNEQYTNEQKSKRVRVEMKKLVAGLPLLIELYSSQKTITLAVLRHEIIVRKTCKVAKKAVLRKQQNKFRNEGVEMVLYRTVECESPVNTHDRAVTFCPHFL